MAPSDPFDDAFAEQALRPEQQEDQRDHVSQPGFDAAAEQRAPVKFTELLADADDDAADDRAGDRSEAAEDQHRQRLERDDLERERNIGTRTPHDAGRQRDDAGGEPHDHPDVFQRDADRERGAVAVGDQAQSAPNASPMRVFWKNTPSEATISEAMIAAAISIFCICTKPPSIGIL